MVRLLVLVAAICAASAEQEVETDTPSLLTLSSTSALLVKLEKVTAMVEELQSEMKDLRSENKRLSKLYDGESSYPKHYHEYYGKGTGSTGSGVSVQDLLSRIEVLEAAKLPSRMDAVEKLGKGSAGSTACGDVCSLFTVGTSPVGGRKQLILDGTDLKVKDANVLIQSNCTIDVKTVNHYGNLGKGNLIVGQGHDYSKAVNSVAFGRNNIVDGCAATVTGGANNKALSTASVSGGANNTAQAFWASISGGKQNEVNGDYSSVSGGGENTVSGEASSILGGKGNKVPVFTQDAGKYGKIEMSKYVSILGGERNKADGFASAVVGGYRNTVNGERSVVVGGEANTVGRDAGWVGSSSSDKYGYASTGTVVVGGSGNKAEARSGVILGGNINKMTLEGHSGRDNVILGGSDNKMTDAPKDSTLYGRVITADQTGYHFWQPRGYTITAGAHAHGASR